LAGSAPPPQKKPRGFTMPRPPVELELEAKVGRKFLHLQMNSMVGSLVFGLLVAPGLLLRWFIGSLV